MKGKFPIVFGGILLLVYAWFSWLLLEITMQYFPIRFDVAFLRIKQEYVHLTHYKIGFYVHVIFSVMVLPAGFTQFSKSFRLKFPRAHRIIGWSYASVILLFAAPSGFLIGMYANGGIWSQISFCILAVLWFWFTLKAVLTARTKDFKTHQKFMIRSFALTLSAITLRMWKYLIILFFHPRPMDVYRIIAWLGWVLNLLIAEWIIYYYLSQKKKKRTVIQSQR